MPLKAVYIGSKAMWNFWDCMMEKRTRPNCDWQIPITSPKEYQSALSNGKIEKPSIIAVSSHLYAEAHDSNNQEELNGFLDFICKESESTPVVILNDHEEDQFDIDGNHRALHGWKSQGLHGR